MAVAMDSLPPQGAVARCLSLWIRHPVSCVIVCVRALAPSVRTPLCWSRPGGQEALYRCFFGPHTVAGGSEWARRDVASLAGPLAGTQWPRPVGVTPLAGLSPMFSAAAQQSSPRPG